MKRIIAVLVVLMLSMPAFSIGEQNVKYENNNLEVLEIIPQDEEKTLNESNSVIESEDLVKTNMPTPYKEPVSKKELAKKLILAMICVAGSSIFLYVVLKLYNKFRDSFSNIESSSVIEDKSLSAPDDLTGAVKSFIEQTRWYE